MDVTLLGQYKPSLHLSNSIRHFIFNFSIISFDVRSEKGGKKVCQKAYSNSVVHVKMPMSQSLPSTPLALFLDSGLL